MRPRILGFLLPTAVALLSAVSLASAQQSVKVWRIGFLANVPPTTSPEAARIFEAFQRELRDRGYVEGKKLAIEFRFSEDGSKGSRTSRRSWSASRSISSWREEAGPALAR
jgi:hypothetical protein